MGSYSQISDGQELADRNNLLLDLSLKKTKCESWLDVRKRIKRLPLSELETKVKALLEQAVRENPLVCRLYKQLETAQSAVDKYETSFQSLQKKANDLVSLTDQLRGFSDKTGHLSCPKDGSAQTDMDGIPCLREPHSRITSKGVRDDAKDKEAFVGGCQLPPNSVGTAMSKADVTLSKPTDSQWSEVFTILNSPSSAVLGTQEKRTVQKPEALPQYTQQQSGDLVTVRHMNPGIPTPGGEKELCDQQSTLDCINLIVPKASHHQPVTSIGTKRPLAGTTRSPSSRKKSTRVNKTNRTVGPRDTGSTDCRTRKMHPPETADTGYNWKSAKRSTGRYYTINRSLFDSNSCSSLDLTTRKRGQRLLRYPSDGPPPLVPIHSTMPPGSGQFILSDVRPILKLTQTPVGVELEWTVNGCRKQINLYEIETHSHALGSHSNLTWDKIGHIKSLPLPMTCIISKLKSGHKHYFRIRAYLHGSFTQFSEPQSIAIF